MNGAQAFVAAVKDVSELYKLNVKITERTDHISADFYFNAGGGLGYMKEVLKLADEISFFSNVRGYDIVMSLDYYTHAVFVGGRQVHPWRPVHTGLTSQYNNGITWQGGYHHEKVGFDYPLNPERFDRKFLLFL